MQKARSQREILFGYHEFRILGTETYTPGRADILHTIRAAARGSPDQIIIMITGHG